MKDKQEKEDRRSVDEVNKLREREWRIKTEEFTEASCCSCSACLCVCAFFFFYVFGLEMAGQMGNE